jgi:hypothetical protein
MIGGCNPMIAGNDDGNDDGKKAEVWRGQKDLVGRIHGSRDGSTDE